MSLAVVGVDYTNKSGPTRRFEIAVSVPGEPVFLIPEPRNPADPNAIAVFSCRHVQIGYLRAERAPLVATYLSRARITAAIFQAAAHWGAIVRVGLDGEAPSLPDIASSDPVEADSGFWPDYIPPDD